MIEYLLINKMRLIQWEIKLLLNKSHLLLYVSSLIALSVSLSTATQVAYWYGISFQMVYEMLNTGQGLGDLFH